MNSSAQTMKKIMFGVFGVGFLGVIALQIFMEPTNKQSDPEVVAQNFVHYIETDQLNKANELSNSTLRDKPQWMGMLRQFNQNIEAGEVNFKTLAVNGDIAKIQFYSQPPIVLNLKNESGKWSVMAPSNQ